MKKTILDFLEGTRDEHSNSDAIGDLNGVYNYSELVEKSKQVGTVISENNILREPVLIFMQRGKNVPVAMLGTLYSGNFYVVLDVDSPTERLEKIIKTLSSRVVIYEEQYEDVVNSVCENCTKICFDNIKDIKINEVVLSSIRKQMLSTDPAYSIFTSGSTGFPKGALLTHQNVISYIDWYTSCFDITSETVFGSQTPLYFSMSVSDFYASIFTGSAYHMIPKQYFAFPMKLVEFMNERKVNTIYWVPSALGIAAKLNLFKYCKPEYLKKVLFAGEVMPVKYLNYWKEYFKDALYANLFGPTETTDICAYYIVNRDFADTQTLPIGNSCENSRLFICDENGQEVIGSGEGELFVAGPFVGSGYYNNKKKTSEVFVQNPLQANHNEIVYKTGDLVSRNKYGELEYHGRKDFQIKRMGYRIEPGEIEAVFGKVEDIGVTLCIYDANNDELILAYEGDCDKENILRQTAESSLTQYMHPDKYYAMDSFPKNQNGKIDRKNIEKIIKNR